MTNSSIRNLHSVAIKTFGWSVLLFCLFLPSPAPAAAHAGAAVYYVSQDGNDEDSGTSPAESWETVGRVNIASLGPGDTVLFRRGDAWREQLLPRSGSSAGHVTYSAYGAGDKPLLLGSIEKNLAADWGSGGGNLWVLDDVVAVDVGNIIFDGEAAVGSKVWEPYELDTQGEFWYDEAGQTVVLYSTSNPAFHYGDIECALTRHIIDEHGRSYVVYEDLALKYGGGHGIGGGQTHHIIVRDCDISFIGGGELPFPGYDGIRYGNGIEFWGNAHDNLVEGCRLWEIYDAALTCQNTEEQAVQSNIAFLNNLIMDCEYSFEYWNRPDSSSTSGIRFENNSCITAGGGWGHIQRPNPEGRHLFFNENTAATSGMVIANNIFFQATDNAFWLSSTFNGLEGLFLDHNCYYQPNGEMIRYQNRSYSMAEFAAYQSETGQEQHGFAADPLFTGEPPDNWYLSRIAAGQQWDSPCADAGNPLSVVPDGTTRTDGVPDAGIVDLGFHYAEGQWAPGLMWVNLVTGPGPAPENPPLVRNHHGQWLAYGVSGYGVNVACGDLDGSGLDEVITGPGPGAVFGPHVRGWTADGSPVQGVSFLAYGTSKFGVNVTTGDIDGDGFDEIITGAGPGAVFGPHVRAWKCDITAGVSSMAGVNYLAYGTPKWGVNVAAGDIDGDGFDEIITGAGPGAVYGPHVRGWNVDGGSAAAMPEVSFLAYTTPRWGVNVDCGDLDGDGIDEIVTGAGPGSIFGAHVRGWNYDGTALAPLPGTSYFAYTTLYGVSVGTGDVDGDGIDEILTMPGPSRAASTHLRAWNVHGGTVSLVPGVDGLAYEDWVTHGGRVAGGKLENEICSNCPWKTGSSATIRCDSLRGSASEPPYTLPTP